MLSSPLIGSAAFKALNYMWVVSTGREAWPVSERGREPGPWESIVSEIGKRGRDRDDRQATRSATATSPPSYPTHPTPPPLTPVPLSPARLGQLTWKVRWRLPAPSRWVMMRLPISVSYRSPSKQKSPKKEIDIIPPHLIFSSFFFSVICVYLVTAPAHVVWLVFRQVAPGNMSDFFRSVIALLLLKHLEIVIIIVCYSLPYYICTITPDNMRSTFCTCTAVTSE